jgi:hypothetical protein
MLTAWTMTHVMTSAGRAYRQLMAGLAILLAAVVAAVALPTRLAWTWSRNVSRIESTLAPHDIAELPSPEAAWAIIGGRRGFGVRHWILDSRRVCSTRLRARVAHLGGVCDRSDGHGCFAHRKDYQPGMAEQGIVVLPRAVVGRAEHFWVPCPEHRHWHGPSCSRGGIEQPHQRDHSCARAAVQRHAAGTASVVRDCADHGRTCPTQGLTQRRLDAARPRNVTSWVLVTAPSMSPAAQERDPAGPSNIAFPGIG